MLIASDLTFLVAMTFSMRSMLLLDGRFGLSTV